MKRLCDIVVSTTALVLLGPLFLWVAWKIRREGDGPVLFRQERVGRNGETFRILKFRTMRVDAVGPAFTAAGDSRITPFGRWLRSRKLDELPQLWNVLRGEMSLVGPRPEVPEYVALYPEGHRLALTARPGITGVAQLQGLREEEELASAENPERYYREVLLPRKAALDAEYALHASWTTDLQVIVHTIGSFFPARSDRWLRQILSIRRPFIVTTTALLVVASYVGAYYLRAEFSIPDEWWPRILDTIPFLVISRLLVYERYGLFHGWWRYTGVNDFIDILRAVAVSSAFFVTPVVLLFGTHAMPRSVVLIDGVLQIAILAGSRYTSRALWMLREGLAGKDAEDALVIGEIPAAEPLLREIFENRRIPIRPVGIVTVGEARPTGRIHGVPIFGHEDRLPAILEEHPVDILLLALPAHDGATIRRIVSGASRSGVRFKIVPPLQEILDERLRLEDVRDVDIDDLLGRSEVRVPTDHIRDTLRGRRILITGAAGSIGSELARQIAACEPEGILLLDRSEHPLFALQQELREGFPDSGVRGRLCDLRNLDLLRSLFSEWRPEIVFHAAAYKHVPMMELNPLEAVKNNVFVTRALLEHCEATGVEKFVLISTDKAIRPVNIMGRTKRVAERLIDTSDDRSRCRKMAVRFGNVLGSEGSVVPILLRQIEAGGPVTITDPAATRYFMTIHEAVHLVLQAAAFGEGGEVFVLDMGEPVRILDLARSLIRLAGLDPGRDIEIRFTGLRPGERLHEETLLDPEATGTSHAKIWARRQPRHSRPELERLERLVAQQDRDGVFRWLEEAC